jgi:pimeloyl-ACP methyl ester carboxylesterase
MSLRTTKTLRVFLTIAICYGLLLICGCAWQRKLLYFPTKISAGDVEQASARSGLEPWRNAAGEIIGWKLAANSTSTGSVLVIHGNGGCALQRGYFAKPIHDAAALDVFILEFPGYGMRSGSPSLKSILAAAEEAFALLPKDSPVYLVSESLGTGVAAHLAKMFPNEIAGMVMFVPYDSLPSLAQSKMPLLLPYFFLVDRYEPAAWLKDYRGPIKFVLAERDQVIPMKFGQRLVDSYAGPKVLQIIPNAGHDDVGEQSPEWWREVFNYLHNSIHPKS